MYRVWQVKSPKLKNEKAGATFRTNFRRIKQCVYQKTDKKDSLIVIKALKYGYPPDKIATAIDAVMEQTKLMCSNEMIYAEGANDNSSEYRVAQDTGKY